nr:7070_t:CDS:2 [Entrophospora candida]
MNNWKKELTNYHNKQNYYYDMVPLIAAPRGNIISGKRLLRKWVQPMEGYKNGKIFILIVRFLYNVCNTDFCAFNRK